MDLFTKARLKIAFLYFLLGIVILGVAGYFIYADLTAIVGNILQTVQELLSSRAIIDQATTARVIAQSIGAQVQQMDFSIGLWLIVAMVFSAYLLAGITLRPVKRAMERQKRFMANISHELRTPLSVMRTNTEAALMGGAAVAEGELAETVKSNLEELDRMAKIIEFLLNFSNIENRASRVAFSAVDVVRAAERAINLMQRIAGDKKITLSLTGVAGATVSGNTTAIEQMILNLLKNAIAYTPPGGRVAVRVAKTLRSIIVSVEDSGMGIPAKDLPNVFEAFYRGNNTEAGKKDGSVGLGLAIVREMAIFHNAKIAITSAVHKGTTISVRFPRRLSRWFALP